MNTTFSGVLTLKGNQNLLFIRFGIFGYQSSLTLMCPQFPGVGRDPGILFCFSLALSFLCVHTLQGPNNVFDTVALLAYVVATKLGNSINNKPLDMRNFGFVDIVKEEVERIRARERWER